MNDSKSAGSFSVEDQTAQSCSYMPAVLWNSSDVIKAPIVVTCLTCPITILLNILIIVVVTMKESLRSNINILLCSMAVTDLLVGAAVQPLMTLSTALFLRDERISAIQCNLDSISAALMLGTCLSSIFHLTVIAWQRHARITLDMDNNPTSMSKRRVKVAIFAVWLTALILTIPSAMIALGVKLQYIIYLDIAVFVVIVVCWILIAYYYISIYIKTRKITVHPVHQNISLATNANVEKRIAFTTGLLTLIVLLFYSPSLVFVLCYFYPIFCEGSFIFWAVTIIQLNSLANPILYCYRNRHIRRAILELLRI